MYCLSFILIIIIIIIIAIYPIQKYDPDMFSHWLCAAVESLCGCLVITFELVLTVSILSS